MNLYCLATNSPSKRFQFRKTVKMTIQVLYDKSLFDNYDNAEEVLRIFFVERRRLDLEEVNDDIQ